MNEQLDRYDRNIRLFGRAGQQQLHATSTLVVGVGGLGSPLVQQLVLLGVGEIFLVDDEELEESNRNRFIGCREDDPIPGSKKVEISARFGGETNTDVRIIPLAANLLTPDAFQAIKMTDWVFGCLDEDGPRAILNEVCAAYEKPYIDLASDVIDGRYGGRICVSVNGDGCIHCLGLLDGDEVRRYLLDDDEQQREAGIYGVPSDVLGTIGPSVAPLNGVIAALAAVEFMVAATGMRAPTRLIEYRADQSKVLVNLDKPKGDCEYCKGIRGQPDLADVERYLRARHQTE